MKRRFIENIVLGYTPPDPDVENYKDLIDYANRLHLLNDIPLTYLLSDVSDLPPESIRFGVVDINWTDAYIDGAFSIGRVCGEDGATDKKILGSYKKYINKKQSYLDTPRIKKMHKNHRIKQYLINQEQQNDEPTKEDLSVISVVLIKSELIKTKKGLHFSAYAAEDYDHKKNKPIDNRNPLKILRIEEISNDVMICLFSGIIDVFIIEEPKTGLKFGCDENQCIDLRSARDDDTLGNRLRSLYIKKYNDENGNQHVLIEDNGKINAKELADYIQFSLTQQDPSALDIESITPSRFAFEMISIAHKAIFSANQLEE